jgi:hypothetical protein
MFYTENNESWRIRCVGAHTVPGSFTLVILILDLSEKRVELGSFTPNYGCYPRDCDFKFYNAVSSTKFL